MKTKLYSIKDFVDMYTGSFLFLTILIIAVILLLISLTVLDYYISPDYAENRAADYVCFSDKTENSFVYNGKQYTRTELEEGWSLKEPQKFILTGHSSTGIKFNANRMFYYEEESTPTVFSLTTDSFSVYYSSAEDLAYPSVNTELPDEIFINCPEHSVAITLSNKTTIEEIVSNISPTLKLSEIISDRAICDCSYMSVLVHWNDFPLEYRLK